MLINGFFLGIIGIVVNIGMVLTSFREILSNFANVLIKTLNDDKRIS